MKYLLLFPAIFLSISSSAQDCSQEMLAKKPGTWKAGQQGSIHNVSATDLAKEKSIIATIHKLVSTNYKPTGCQISYSTVYGKGQGTGQTFIADPYHYGMYILRYLCDPASSDKSKWYVDISTPTTVNITANVIYSLNNLYAANLPADESRSYLKLKQRPEKKDGYYFMGEEKVDYNDPIYEYRWLITYNDTLPFRDVSRKEYLLIQKKRLEKDIQDSPSEKDYLSRYIKTIDEYLKQPDEELKQPAICMWNEEERFEKFVEEGTKGSFIAVKPNLTYYRKNLPKSSPHFFSVVYKIFKGDPVFEENMANIKKAVDFSKLKNMLGAQGMEGPNSTQKDVQQKTTTSSPGKMNTQMAVANNTNTNNNTITSGNSNISNANGKGNTLSGNISAPAGTAITLAFNNANDLTVNIPKAPNKLFGSIPFSFPKKTNDNIPYDVMLKKIPSNMKGVVYNGKGTAPNGTDKIKVGVDYTYELISRSSDDKTISDFYQSREISIGGYNGEEGRYVAFVSSTKGLEGSNGKYRQIFWRDRNTGITKLISASSTGEQGNADSYAPSLSADGKLLVFESNASNLVEGDNNNVKDIFLWNTQTNSIQLVTKASNGNFADAESFEASISGNGQFVVFTSNANNLISGKKGYSMGTVYLHDLINSKTEMISIDPTTGSGAYAGKASISFDGSRITFSSISNTLVKNDNNGLWDIFLWQRGQKELKRISMTHDGKERNQGQESASRFVASAISGNGRYVAYATTATNLTPNDNNNFQDVFVYDIETNKVTIVSQTDDGKPADDDSPVEQAEKVAISYDGTWIAFPTKSTNLGTQSLNIVLHNMVTGKKQIVSNVRGSYVGKPEISYSGSYVLFAKGANLDNRFSSSGIFAYFTGNGPCRDCKE